MKTIVSKILLLLLFPVCIPAAFGQFRPGLEAGPVFSTQSGIGDICHNTGIVTGISIGITGKYDLKPLFALSSGIFYKERGKKCDLDSEKDIVTRYNYLVVPIKAEFSSGENSGMKKGQKLFFATGPWFGYLLSVGEINVSTALNLDEQTKKGDFGWCAEVGIYFPAGESKSIRLSANYDMGMYKISTENKDLQNKSFGINLGILW